MLLAACTPESSVTTTTLATVLPETTTTATVPTTTTTTIDPEVMAGRTCDALKVASFDLGAHVDEVFASLHVSGDTQVLDDGRIGRAVVGSLVGFYDAVGTTATLAPPEIADDLRTVAEAVQPWREALSASDDVGAALDGLDPIALRTPDVERSLGSLAQWTESNCGVPITLDTEEILFGTIFPAMFGAVGDSLDGGAGGRVDGTEPAPFDLFAVAYGDDRGLDDLYDSCGTGDGAACSDLSFTAFGEYQVWGQTCGATVMLFPADAVDCGGKLGGTAASYGDDFVLDSLQDACAAGDATSCDGLFAASPFGSAYEAFGATCGGLREADAADRPCAFAASGEAYSYGDDVDNDTLWDGCAAGDGQSCSDLFFATPFDSAYESFGRTCGDLVDAAKSCEAVAAWLGGPRA